MKDSVYDVNASLGLRFAGAPEVGALVTTYAMSFLDRASGIRLADLYSRGVPLGRAVADLNTRHFARYSDDRNVVLLFGDPELRLREARALALDRIAFHSASLGRFIATAGVPPYGIQSSSQIEKPGAEPIPGCVFSAVDYTRAIVAGTKVLRRSCLDAPLDRLAASTEELWIGSSLFNSRLSQHNRLNFRAPIMLPRQAKLLRQYQHAWLDYYVALVSHLGGYVRFQVDRYFAQEPMHGESLDIECPYCKGPVLISMASMAGVPHVRRKLVECYNCATIRDGSECTLSGEIDCAPRWRLADELSIAVTVRTSRRGDWMVLAAAILEPFLKRSGSEPQVISAEGTFTIEPAGLRINWPAETVGRQFGPGTYHLNALVLVDADVLLLRRPVHLD